MDEMLYGGQACGETEVSQKGAFGHVRHPAEVLHRDGLGILLLDEPLSALDAKLRKELRAQIKTIQKELRITTLYVTHDQEEALAISDRIIVMKDGSIQQVNLLCNSY